ncbi:HsdR family type I site-specific deoxyribonuclease [Sulfurimonas sp.]|uniref:type I restriction endonuclease subunit R n=1 Tax=Sulfurimonas sp. TaxID=2022749 RepID=UPI0025CEC50B|nr:HsdR family type I site-specific deoxyribonuclease [Sulfurimonas sp.]
MSNIGQIERATQNRVVKLFNKNSKDFNLGYTYLGDWTDREDNKSIEVEYLTKYLNSCGYNQTLITKTLRELDQACVMGDGRKLYEANQDVYKLLRYGIKIKEDAGSKKKTLWLIDWKNPEENDFYIAEEVSIKGENKKRPDIVLYVNGIALGVIELKRATASVAKGIRQNLDNQKKEFIRDFFTTMQLVMAGNDTEGLRYGTIETSEKYYLTWKEEDPDYNPKIDSKDKKYLSNLECDGGENALDCAIIRLLNKKRFLEIIHDFIVFDSGVKKTCRHNQYFGMKEAQKHIAKREGGIIWHTQGSGKSLTMVWLAKWIRANVKSKTDKESTARVLVITDRTELDEQIERVFNGVDEEIYRTKNGNDLIGTLNKNDEWLMCSLVHKFGGGKESSDEFIKEIQNNIPKDFKAKGELFVFVDECHRTQSGELHDAMKLILPNAMFIGFTGTPLLKDDKKNSIEIFGGYIHTYKFDEAVSDGVILDLQYEPRDIDQYITSQDKVDKWFDIKTRGLSDIAKVQVKQKWGTLQKVLSSQSRLEQIVNDILMDMETRPRLMDDKGNAMLVCASIYEACKVYELFDRTHLKGKCAIVTSYIPSIADIKGEESAEGQTEKLRKYDIYRKMLADYFEEAENTAVNKIETFEKEVKKKFIKNPGQMKLLIVVDKLLTGFDAPSATYLYIDKKLRDHGLFQAICRVNRLDGEDKEYGYIIDYQDLFNSLEGAINDYTSEAFDKYEKDDIEGLLTNRLDKAKQSLEDARESIKALCEPVEEPKNSIDYIHYFCANDTTSKDELKDNEPKRVALYKCSAALLRAYANLANEMQVAGYTREEFDSIKQEVTHFEKLREEIKLASGDYVDMKMLEPAMRHLIDTYIKADDSEILANFDEMGLIELIVEKNVDELEESMPKSMRKNNEAMSEAIENNMRKLIIDENPVNPKYFDKMSELLDELIKERKDGAIEYKKYLQKIKELASRVTKPDGDKNSDYPSSLDSSAKRALYDNLDNDETLAIKIDTAIKITKKDNWIGNKFKEKEVLNAIKQIYTEDQIKLDKIMELIKHQNEYR